MSHIYQTPYDEGFSDGQEAANRIAELEAQVDRLTFERAKLFEQHKYTVKKLEADYDLVHERFSIAMMEKAALWEKNAELKKELEESQWMYQGLVEENAKLWLTGAQASRAGGEVDEKS